jgi:hypothetical protein
LNELGTLNAILMEEGAFTENYQSFIKKMNYEKE